MKYIISLLIFMSSFNAKAQKVSDMGNNNYKNPIIYADYSDPDVIRIKDDLYYGIVQF